MKNCNVTATPYCFSSEYKKISSEETCVCYKHKDITDNIHLHILATSPVDTLPPRCRVTVESIADFFDADIIDVIIDSPLIDTASALQKYVIAKLNEAFKYIPAEAYRTDFSIVLINNKSNTWSAVSTGHSLWVNGQNIYVHHAKEFVAANNSEKLFNIASGNVSAETCIFIANPIIADHLQNTDLKFLFSKHTLFERLFVEHLSKVPFTSSDAACLFIRA